MNMRTPLLALLAAAPLAGCISLAAKPPPSLLTLSPGAAAPLGETRRSDAAGTITIGVPAAAQELATGRVPVRSGGTAIAYVKDAQWVEPPARLFARLLADTISARTGRMVLSYRQSRANPGAQLSGEIRVFGIDAETHEAVVAYDGALQRGADPVFEKRRFEARVDVPRIDSEHVGPALNEAANQVAAQVAEWVGE